MVLIIYMPSDPRFVVLQKTARVPGYYISEFRHFGAFRRRAGPMGLWLSLALELEVGADILRTAVAPT